MRNPTGLFATVAIAITLTAAPGARASVTKYTSQGTFEALGVIDQKTDFDAFDPTKNTSPGTPYSVGLLTLDSDDNVVDGYLFPGSEASRNLIINDGSGPHAMGGSIDGAGHNLFAFRIGELLQGTGEATLTLFMDGGASSTFAVSDPQVFEGLAFHGFLAPDGHYFTGFKVTGNTDAGIFSVVGLTDFEIGHTATVGGPIGCVDTSRTCDIGGGVPEPSAWALMILGFGGVGALLRRRRVIFA